MSSVFAIVLVVSSSASAVAVTLPAPTPLSGSSAEAHVRLLRYANSLGGEGGFHRSSGWEASSRGGFVHGEFGAGAEIGTSTGMALTLEASHLQQELEDPICLAYEGCEETAAPRGRRSATLASIRAGYVGRFVGVELGVGWYSRSDVHETDPEVQLGDGGRTGVAYGVRLGPAAFHGWVDTFAGPLTGVERYGRTDPPIRLGIGHASRWVRMHGSVGHSGQSAQIEVPISGEIWVGATAWKSQTGEEVGCAVRTAVRFGHPYPIGRRYSPPEVQP